MFLAKFLSVLLISLSIVQGLPVDDFSSEDDRINEISNDYGRHPVIPDVDRIFSSAELQQTPRRDREYRQKNRIVRSGDGAETTKSSKHAHNMITSMLSFVSSVLNFGRTIIRNE